MTPNLFFKANKAKLKFLTGRGLRISTEQLFDLPLTARKSDRDSLEDIWNMLKSEREKVSDQGFLADSAKNPAALELDLKISVVEAVRDSTQADNAARLNARAAQSRKAELQALIKQKKTESASVDDLEKELAALG